MRGTWRGYLCGLRYKTEATTELTIVDYILYSSTVNYGGEPCPLLCACVAHKLHASDRDPV